MANRTLVWFIPAPDTHAEQTSYKQVIKTDREYRATAVWIHAKRGPGTQPFKVDILDDGASMIDLLALPVPQTKGTGRFAARTIAQGSYISLDIIQPDPSIGDVTVGLELETV